MSDTSTHIEEAYCVENGEIIDIWEARDLYFSISGQKRKRFHFECPDEECRNVCHPEIIGVNYSNEEYLNTPHFRINPNYKHIDECYLSKFEKVIRKMIAQKHIYRQNSDRNMFLDIEDSEDIPDVFVTKQEIDEAKSKRETIKKNVKYIYGKDIKSMQHRICTGYKRTRSLRNIVDWFEKLNDSQRAMAQLTINGNRYSYGKLFKPICFMEEWHTWPHIYYGTAKIFHYKKKENGFRAFFTERVKCYAPEYKNLEASVFFPLKGEKIPTSHPYDALNLAANSGQQCNVYMFASRCLVNEPLGSNPEPKPWIKLSVNPDETVITFKEREFK